MKIAIPKERRAHEARVAATPETVKKLIALGAEVVVESGAGVAASVSDDVYVAAGASIARTVQDALAGADLVFKVAPPLLEAETGSDGTGTDEVALLPEGVVLVSHLNPHQRRDMLTALAARKVTAFALELVPRITRAQSMDVLSSQANLAGYKAVLDAAAEYPRVFPMMMTAAGTVAPARCLVLGAGVAGLQAIATARRLGAIVSAYDVRPAVKEQVESLGASFVEVDPDAAKDAETKGGYAKEMGEDYKRRQAQVLAETLPKNDIVICTAQIPGRTAPRLVEAEVVGRMKPGSVIIDLASESGGNCALTRHGEIVVTDGGVRIVAHANVPSRLAEEASRLYARNLVNFVTPLVDKESKALAIDFDDDIVKGALVTRDGAIVHPALAAAD